MKRPAPIQLDELPRLTNLTARQNDVLQLLAKGLTQVEVAKRLGVSPGMIGRHLAGIHGRLGVWSMIGIGICLHRAQLRLARRRKD